MIADRARPRYAALHHASGLSLIELMVALAIGAVLTIGLLQIFSASRASSQMQEGLSRVQENGRFAVQYLARNLRMVGYMGCGADTGRIAQVGFVNHLSMYADGSVPGGPQFRFQRPLEGYRAGVDTAPAEFASITPVAQTDVVIMRMFSEESEPVLSTINSGMDFDITLADGAAPFLPAAGKAAVFAMENCRSADVFAGAIAGNVLKIKGGTPPNVYRDPTVSACGQGGGCPFDFRLSNASLNAKPIVGGAARLNAQVHRAEYVALFVMNRPNTTTPALYMRRFERDSTSLGAPEELVEGVENMQVRYGYDTDGDGTADEYRTAADVIAGAADDAAIDANWRRVVSVRVAMLLRSPQRAAVPGGSRTYSLLGTDVTAADDGLMRQVYETTIALRNRLFST